jgi:hypothetical protein
VRHPLPCVADDAIQRSGLGMEVLLTAEVKVQQGLAEPVRLAERLEGHSDRRRRRRGGVRAARGARGVRVAAGDTLSASRGVDVSD